MSTRRRLPSVLTPGNPGNSGGKPGRSGRPPSLVRQRVRGSFADRVRILEEIADDQTAPPADRLRALEIMARYSLGNEKQVSVSDVQMRVAQTVALIRRRLPVDEAERIVAGMVPIWS